MNIGLRGKFTILILVLVIALGSVMTTYHVRSQVNQSFNDFDRRAQAVAKVLGLQLSDSLLKGEDVSMANRLPAILWAQAFEDIRHVSAYDPDGIQRLSIRPDDEIDLTEIQSEQYRQLLYSDANSLSRHRSEDDLYDTLVPIRAFGTNIGVVRLGLDTTRIQKKRQQILLSGLGITAITAFVVLLIGFFLTSRVLKPLNNLVRVTREFGDGNLDARASVETTDEVGQLVSQFNRMAQSIQDRVEEREQSLRRLQTIQEVGQIMNESARPEELGPVLDQALETLYDSEQFVFLIENNGVFEVVHARPKLNGSLYLDAEHKVITEAETASLSELPDYEDLPEELDPMTHRIPLEVADRTYGLLVLKLTRTLDERERGWLRIWTTQVAQAVRGMVEVRNLEDLRDNPLGSIQSWWDRITEADYTELGRFDLANYDQLLDDQGLYAGSELQSSLEQELDELDLDLRISRMLPNRFIVAGRNLTEFERSRIEDRFDGVLSNGEWNVTWHDMDDADRPRDLFLSV